MTFINQQAMIAILKIGMVCTESVFLRDSGKADKNIEMHLPNIIAHLKFSQSSALSFQYCFTHNKAKGAI